MKMKRIIAFFAFGLYALSFNTNGQDMGFFKKKPTFNIDEILKKSDPTEIVMAIDEHLNQKSNYGEDIEVLTEPERVILFIENLEREINNGGFNQFYFNSSGDFSHETVDVLIKIGATKTSEIVRMANSEFPDSTVPKDRTKRQIQLEQIKEVANSTWEQCDQKFYQYEDDLVGLLLLFVKEHKSEFN